MVGKTLQDRLVKSTLLDICSKLIKIQLKMKTIESEIHPVQSRILTALLFKPQAKFSKLNTTRMSTDHFTFHIHRLTDLGLIEKIAGNYQLTTKGKEFANRFDTAKKQLERQAKVGVQLICIKDSKYLIQQRLKQPYYGFFGFLGGKISWGETVFETVKRELMEETGLTGKFKLVGIRHKMDYDQEGNLLEDKYFFVVKITNIKGKLKTRFEGGRNQWLTKKEYLQQENLFDGVEKSLQIAGQNGLVFSEEKYKVKKY